MKIRPLYSCILVLALALGSASCAKKIVYSTPVAQPKTALPGHKAADPQKALQRYTRYLETTRAGDPGRSEAWRNAMGSAVQLGEYDLAEKNLQSWQAENKTAPSSWDWNQANAQLLLARKGKDAYVSYLLDLAGRTDLDWTTREAAGMELVDHFWAIPEYGLAFDTMGLIYKAAPDDATKSALEAGALSRAESLPVDELRKVLDNALGADPSAYPWSMVVWAQSMKLLAQDKANWASVWPSLSTIVRSGGLANRDFFAGNLRALEQEQGVVKQSLVLLLPLSGPYSQVGWKIAKGADTAWREGRAQTEAPAIKLINTESPTFLDELRAVSGVPIIGGPLRKEIWGQIRLAGLHRSARFMTFMPSVEDEGVDAWRFFSSPEDQTRAVIRGCEQLGSHVLRGPAPPGPVRHRHVGCFSGAGQNPGRTRLHGQRLRHPEPSGLGQGRGRHPWGQRRQGRHEPRTAVSGGLSARFTLPGAAAGSAFPLL
jgi:uncharacterized protein